SSLIANHAGIVAKGVVGLAQDWYLEVVNGHYEFGVSGGRLVDSNASIVAGQWTSLIGVFDASALPQPVLKIYVNGVLDNQVQVLGATRVTTTQPITVGASSSSLTGAYSQTFAGQIDEVEIAAQAYTNADASSYYQGAFVSTLTLPSPNNGI